jgi:hypothetical protein
MTTLTVNIANEKDLPLMEEILNRFGLSYQINTDYNFTEQEIQGLLKTKQDFLEGKTTARNWNDIEQDLNNAFH